MFVFLCICIEKGEGNGRTSERGKCALKKAAVMGAGREGGWGGSMVCLFSLSYWWFGFPSSLLIIQHYILLCGAVKLCVEIPRFSHVFNTWLNDKQDTLNRHVPPASLSPLRLPPPSPPFSFSLLSFINQSRTNLLTSFLSLHPPSIHPQPSSHPSCRRSSSPPGRRIKASLFYFWTI